MNTNTSHRLITISSHNNLSQERIKIPFIYLFVFFESLFEKRKFEDEATIMIFLKDRIFAKKTSLENDNEHDTGPTMGIMGGHLVSMNFYLYRATEKR